MSQMCAMRSVGGKGGQVEDNFPTQTGTRTRHRTDTQGNDWLLFHMSQTYSKMLEKYMDMTLCTMS